MVQDRIQQKNWLRDQGYPVGAYRAVYSEDNLLQAVAALGPRIYLKRARGGYDGRGQVKLDGSEAARVGDAWRVLGEEPCVAEQAFDLESEISVMVARNPSGEVVAYPAATNHHEQQILVWSALPSSIPAALEKQAQEIATTMACQLKLEGLLAVEMFVTSGNGLYVNELAPRPHNSYHASQRCCVTSQFEQAVRAVCFSYKCKLTSGTASARAKCGSSWSPFFSQRSPSRLAIAAGRIILTSPRGRSHTARTACSNWLVTQQRWLA